MIKIPLETMATELFLLFFFSGFLELGWSEGDERQGGRVSMAQSPGRSEVRGHPVFWAGVGAVGDR